ncbi:MAG: flagellar protein FlaG [Deltaproteobacteria bacterium]|nr:flagellar protein FlaG [Deltaproteobacteria bacterium]
MTVLGNTQANMDVMGVSKAPVLGKAAGVPKEGPQRPDLSKEIKPSEVSRKDVEGMVETLKDLTKTIQTKLDFSVDESTNDFVVKVIDKDTNEVIKQIPPESLLKLQEKMQELTGFLLSDII